MHTCWEFVLTPSLPFGVTPKSQVTHAMSYLAFMRLNHDAQLMEQKIAHSGGANGEVVPVVTPSGRLVRSPVRYGVE